MPSKNQDSHGVEFTYDEYMEKYAPQIDSEEAEECDDPEHVGSEMAERSLEILRSAMVTD